MNATPGSFKQQIDSFCKIAPDRVERVRAAVTIKLFSAVIKDSPVDEGWLRANWQLTTGEAAQGELGQKAPNKIGVTVEEAVTISKAKPGMAVFLTNNLPYAQTAEFGLWHGPTEKVTSAGYSKKSPAGMMRKNVMRFQTLVKQFVAQFKNLNK